MGPARGQDETTARESLYHPVMNKAFVREPDEPDDLHCPRCGAMGQAVSAVTIKAQLREGAAGAPGAASLGSSAFFCANPLCEVAYFDGFGQIAPVIQLRQPVYPKDPDAPICACFGLKAEDVAADARAGNPAGVRMLIEKCKTQTTCETRAANGKCCVDEVQKVYLKNWKK